MAETLRRPQAVIFDLGRVLVRVDTQRGVFAALAQHCDGDDGRLKEILQHPLVYDFLVGKASPQQFHTGMCRELDLTLAYDSFIDLWCDIFDPMPGMEDLVAQVRRKVPVGLLSDTDPVHWQYILDRFPFVGHINHPVLSFEVGVKKPDPQIFLTAARRLAMPCEVCVYIDDLDINVAGAASVGMDAIQFESPEQIRQALTDRGLLT